MEKQVREMLKLVDQVIQDLKDNYPDSPRLKEMTQRKDDILSMYADELL